MSGAPEKTFAVEVPDIGHFVFKRRKMRDEFRIEAEVARLTEGVLTPTPNLTAMATIVAPIKVLAVEVPKDWDIDAMDPFDPEDYKRIAAVHTALAAKENTFRPRKQAGGDPAGQGSKPNP